MESKGGAPGAQPINESSFRLLYLAHFLPPHPTPRSEALVLSGRLPYTHPQPRLKPGGKLRFVLAQGGQQARGIVRRRE